VATHAFAALRAAALLDHPGGAVRSAASRHAAWWATFFGPIMVLWFLTLGIAGLDQHRPRAGRATRARIPGTRSVSLRTTSILGFFALGAAVLALTGAEALYADMGHFGRWSIRIAWFGLVLPALVVNYFGQGALLLRDPASDRQPVLSDGSRLAALSDGRSVHGGDGDRLAGCDFGSFFDDAAGDSAWFLRRAWRSATLRISRWGRSTCGQSTGRCSRSVVALVLGFGSSSNLAAAYGIAVTGTMFITDLLAFVVARYRLGLARSGARFSASLPFAIIDLAFFSANSVKIFDGGWFPLLFGLGVYLLLSTWKQGRDLLEAHLAAWRRWIPRASCQGTAGVTRVPGTAMYLTLQSRQCAALPAAQPETLQGIARAHRAGLGQYPRRSSPRGRQAGMANGRCT
jgi:KUP system potassium uptake protein